MVEGTRGEAYLLVDVGHVRTHAAYISRVEGAGRLVALAQASTTRSAIEGGLLDGVRRATANLERLVGRELLDRAGEVRRPKDAEGHGVDGVVVTTSLAPLLRVALVGLTEGFSLASALRATTLPYVSLERVISLEASEERWDTRDLEALAQYPPDVVVLVGGADGGPVTPIREMAETLSATYSLLPAERRPLVVFAGNERAHKPLRAAFAGIIDVSMVANVRPSPRKEYLGGLQAELTRLFYARLTGPEGLRRLAAWAQADLQHDLDAIARTLRFLARRYDLPRGILGADVGGSGSRVLWVRPEGPALSWVSAYGIGAGLGALRATGNPMSVVRWMQHPLSLAETWDRLSNMEVRPSGVPETDEDWDLQQAAVREALARTWADAVAAWADYPGEGPAVGQADVIVARGAAFDHARSPGEATLMLLDALQPWGLVRLALDWANLLPGLSGLAALEPQAAVQVFDYDGLLELGTLVAPWGRVVGGSAHEGFAAPWGRVAGGSAHEGFAAPWGRVAGGSGHEGFAAPWGRVAGGSAHEGFAAPWGRVAGGSAHEGFAAPWGRVAGGSAHEGFSAPWGRAGTIGGGAAAPWGALRKGARALRARLTVGGELRAEVDVPAGSIRRLPLGVNERGRLELYPAHGLDLGLARRGQGGAVEVRGGALGVIIDARGRPLCLPADDAERRATLEGWRREIETP